MIADIIEGHIRIKKDLTCLKNRHINLGETIAQVLEILGSRQFNGKPFRLEESSNGFRITTSQDGDIVVDTEIIQWPTNKQIVDLISDLNDKEDKYNQSKDQCRALGLSLAE